MIDLVDSLKGRSQDHPREQSLRGVCACSKNDIAIGE